MFPAKTPALIYARYSPTTRHICLWAALVIAAIIAQQSLSVSNAQGGIPHLDKLVHFVAYGALGVLALPALPRMKPLFVVLGIGIFGGIIECAQGFMSNGRTADVMDAMSNLSGAFMALIFWMIITKLRS